jgi:hypothetical protein
MGLHIIVSVARISVWRRHSSMTPYGRTQARGGARQVARYPPHCALPASQRKRRTIRVRTMLHSSGALLDIAGLDDRYELIDGR